MLTVPDGFPFELDDAKLDASLTRMIEDFRRTSPEVRLPELKLAIIQAGLQERSRRETEQLRRATERSARAATLAAWVAVGVTVASVVVQIVIQVGT